MEKIKVLAVLNHDTDKYEVKTKLSHEDIAFLGFVKYGEIAVDKALSFMPNAVVIVNNNGDESRALKLAGDIYMSLPGCAIIILSHTINLAFVEKAMQAGVRKVLDVGCEQNTLIESVKQGYELERTRNKNNDAAAVEYSSKVITVFGAKGGIGKSTIASNLAVALARKKKRVALLDLDLQFGDINLFFDIDPKETIVELVREKQAINIEMIKSYMYLHSSTVSILSAPQSPEMAEVVQGSSVEKIIDTIRPFFDYIVIDAPPYFNEISIVAIENADIVLMVITLDIATLRNTKLSLDILESLQQRDKVSLIVNRVSSGIISVKDAQNILDYPVKYRISCDWKTAISSLNRGVPVVMDAPRSAMGKEFISIGDMLVGDKHTKKRNK